MDHSNVRTYWHIMQRRRHRCFVHLVALVPAVDRRCSKDSGHPHRRQAARATANPLHQHAAQRAVVASHPRVPGPGVDTQRPVVGGGTADWTTHRFCEDMVHRVMVSHGTVARTNSTRSNSTAARSTCRPWSVPHSSPEAGVWLGEGLLAVRVPHHHHPVFVPHPQVALVTGHHSDWGCPRGLQLLVVVRLDIVPGQRAAVRRSISF